MATTKTPDATQAKATALRYIPIVNPMDCRLHGDGATFGVAPSSTTLELVKDVHYLLSGVVAVLAMVTEDEPGGAAEQMVRLARHAAAVAVDRLEVERMNAEGS